jgi:hypothetical protein
MSWFRQIKTLYSTTYVLLLYIIWTLVSCIFLYNKIYFNVFLITLGTVFLMEYLYVKEYKKYIVLGVPLLIGALVLWLTLDLYLCMLNFVFIAASVILVFRDEEGNVNYNEYKNKWIVGGYTIFALTLFSILYFQEGIKPLFKVYVMYFILVIICLRESLRFTYNIRTKYSKHINIGIVAFVVLIFQDYTYKIFSLGVSKLFQGINFVLDKILGVVIYIVQFPVAYGVEFLKKFLSKFDINMKTLDEMQKGLDALVTSKKLFQEDTFSDSYSTWIAINILKFLLAIGILIILIRTISALTKIEKKESGYIEYTEKIEDKKKHKDSLIAKIAKNILRKKGTIKEEILYNFGEFEKITDKVEIYKPYMTASQLKNVTKIKVENVENLDNMTNIYNEAKFSTHEVSSESLDIVKKAVKNAETQLKEVYKKV